MTERCILCQGLGWLIKDTLGRAGYLIGSGTVECPACEGLGQVPKSAQQWAYDCLSRRIPSDGTSIEIPVVIGSN